MRDRHFADGKRPFGKAGRMYVGRCPCLDIFFVLGDLWLSIFTRVSANCDCLFRKFDLALMLLKNGRLRVVSGGCLVLIDA